MIHGLTDVRLREVILEDKRHFYYIETVKTADHLSFHIEGFEFDWYGEKKGLHQNGTSKVVNLLKSPQALMNNQHNIWFDIIVGEYRPEESTEFRSYDYRKKSYRAITKEPPSSAITEYKKITRSSDWNIRLSDERPSKVKEGEGLNEYLSNYPRWGDITSFTNEVLVNKICSDPNQLAIVLPENFESQDETELPNPIVHFFDSQHVLDYVENEYAIVYEEEDDKYWVVTKEEFSIYKINKKGDNRELVRELQLVHPEPLQELNAKKLRGVFKRMKKTQVLYDSFLSPMLPSLDKAARESSDLDAATVRAMYPRPWQAEGMDCKNCVGTGRIQSDGQPTVCPECKGQGSSIYSPSKTLVVGKVGIDEQQAPIPPAGFIEPSTAIIELQITSIQNHNFRALAAINLQFLDKTPLAESGTAKEVDRDSLNNSIYIVASNIVANLKFIIKATNDLRYMVLVPNQEERNTMLPEITIPQDYSIITSAVQLEEFKRAKEAGVSDSTLRNMEGKYISKKNRDSPKIKQREISYLKLDPFPYKTPDQIASMSMNKEISQKDAVIHNYIMPFVDRAFQDIEDFEDMERDDQVKVLEGYADEKITEIEGESPDLGDPPVIEEIV